VLWACVCLCVRVCVCLFVMVMASPCSHTMCEHLYGRGFRDVGGVIGVEGRGMEGVRVRDGEVQAREFLCM